MPHEAKDDRIEKKARWSAPKLTRFAAADAENAPIIGPDLIALS